MANHPWHNQQKKLPKKNSPGMGLEATCAHTKRDARFWFSSAKQRDLRLAYRKYTWTICTRRILVGFSSVLT